MPKKARVVIEVEENFADDVDEGAFEDYDEIDDVGDFAEFVWQKRLEGFDMDGRILNLDCYTVDE